MMFAKAAAAVNRAPFGIFMGIIDVFIISDSASNWASVEGCVDASCSVGFDVVTVTGDMQR